MVAEADARVMQPAWITGVVRPLTLPAERDLLHPEGDGSPSGALSVLRVDPRHIGRGYGAA